MQEFTKEQTVLLLKIGNTGKSKVSSADNVVLEQLIWLGVVQQSQDGPIRLTDRGRSLLDELRRKPRA
jgi:ribosomal protein S19E (S16A)